MPKKYADVKAPDYCLHNAGLTTQRQWRQWKRKQLELTIDAMRELIRGCIYTPKPDKIFIGNIYTQLKQLKLAWSQKEWGK